MPLSGFVWNINFCAVVGSFVAVTMALCQRLVPVCEVMKLILVWLCVTSMAIAQPGGRYSHTGRISSLNGLSDTCHVNTF